MEIELTLKDKKQIEWNIRQKYAKVAVSPEGLFNYPTGKPALVAQNYDPEKISAVPEEAVASYCGVGNPFSLGPIDPGESVLDIGCGGGLDSLVAGMIAGPSGKVVGIDLSSEMVERAKVNLQKTNLTNVIFQESFGEVLSFPNDSFDVAISNGVFNLIPDKLKALQEVGRVLKPGRRLMMADQTLIGEPPKNHQTRTERKKWKMPKHDEIINFSKYPFGVMDLLGNDEGGLNDPAWKIHPFWG